ncbi:glycosyltransferase [Fusobacterium perfoetens]|uniref:glycosyltransferase n=1 Tax=Fusobacterium perfoetens TaxID=852 RepID=UPI0026EE342C|nr:glycosyltransferase [Fusobacterium perfoetens]
MKKMNYSVLMAVYKKEEPEYLKKSIESILNQTYKTNDFVIIKDGELTEELEEVLKDYIQRYKEIHMYGYKKNKGLGYALNYGIDKCRNDLIARMDSDDISLPDRCEKQIKEFANDKTLDIIGTSMYEFSECEDKIETIKYMPLEKEEIKKYSRKRNPFNHPTVMYKKSTVKELGGYPIGIRGEDFALFSSFVFKNKNVKNIREPLLKYRSNKKMFDRRNSLTDMNAVMKVVIGNYKLGYINLSDLLIVIFFQCLGLIIPKKIGYIVYKKFFRSKK